MAAIRNGDASSADPAGAGHPRQRHAHPQPEHGIVRDNDNTSGGNCGVGGIWAVDSTLAITDSTISGNSADGGGGACGSLTLNGTSSIGGTSATGHGGGGIYHGKGKRGLSGAAAPG